MYAIRSYYDPAGLDDKIERLLTHHNALRNNFV